MQNPCHISLVETTSTDISLEFVVKTTIKIHLKETKEKFPPTKTSLPFKKIFAK